MPPESNLPTSDDTPEESLRDTLEAAFEPGEEKPAGEPSPGRERDDHGRFTSKEETPPEATKTAQEPSIPTPPPSASPPGAGEPPAPSTPPAEALKAPASWKPEIREKWATVSPEIQAEVTRREHEMQNVLQQAAGARQFLDAFERTVSPYQMFIAAENTTPLQAVQSLLQISALLRTGSPDQKVQVIGNAIRQWGIDLQMLDGYIASGYQQMGQPGQPQQQQFRDPRVDQMLAEQAQRQQWDQQAHQHSINTEVQGFASDPKHEFFNDLQRTMGDLMSMAARRGEVMTLEQAYERACKLDDGISKILASRSASQDTGAMTQAALRAKRAARSIKGESTPRDGATVPRDESVRGILEAAFEEQSER